MKSTTTTTERTISFENLDEREAHALYAVVNRSDSNVKECANGNELLLEDWFDSQDEAMEFMQNMRDEIMETVVPE